MLNSKNLNLAGWFSIVSAAVTLPLVAIGMVSGLSEDETTVWSYLEIILGAAYLVLYVYIFLMLKRLLNEKAGFHGVDGLITTLIALNIVVTLLSALILPLPEKEVTISIVVLVLLVPIGILSAVFGFKLLNCPDDLFGYRKTFAYLIIATGVMLATVFLMLFSMLTSIAADVVLALIFFKSAKLMETKP